MGGTAWCEPFGNCETFSIRRRAFVDFISLTHDVYNSHGVSLKNKARFSSGSRAYTTSVQ